MSDSTDWAMYLLIGVFIGFAVMGAITRYEFALPNTKLIDECEQNLPRNKYCELIAVEVQP